jgi:homoserine O-acetyltransferase
VEEQLRKIRSKSLVVAITSDILFPPADHKELVECIPNVEYHLIDSDFGHDGFLVEYQQLNEILLRFLGE